MAWEENPRICLHMQLIAILSRTGVYSHISRRSGKPKVAYPSKYVAEKAAEAMGKKHGVHFSVYKCAWCDGWHIGKNSENKIPALRVE